MNPSRPYCITAYGRCRRGDVELTTKRSLKRKAGVMHQMGNARGVGRGSTRWMRRFVLTIAPGLVLVGMAPAQDITSVFDTIKAHEGGFVVPAPYAAARVGVFDAATGRFTWDPATHDTIRSIVYFPSSCDRCQGISGPRTYFAVSVNAVRVGLTFD